MESVLWMLTMAAVCCVCFALGAKVGQRVSKGEPVEFPSVNPVEAVRKHGAKKEAEEERRRLDTILRNIEGYDGTNAGQADVPRGYVNGY